MSQWKLLWDYSSHFRLMLKLELASVVAEKVDDVFLYCMADVDFSADDDGVPKPWHVLGVTGSFESTIMLLS